MKRTGSDDALRCSFCHKSQDVVGKLISSPSDYPRAYICDECIAVCNSILEDDNPKPQSPVQEQVAALREKGQQVHDAMDELWRDLEILLLRIEEFVARGTGN